MAEVTIPDLRSKSSPMFAPKKEDPYVANAVIKTEPGFTIKREPLSPVKAEQWTEHVEQLHVSQQGTENVQPGGALQWEEGDTKGVKREIKQERDNRGRCLQTSSTAEANSSNENHEPHIEDIKPFKKPKIEKKASKRKPSETRPASSIQGQQTSTIPATVLTKQEDIVCTVPNKQEDMVSTVPNKQEDMKTDNSPKTEDTDDEADWSPEDDTGTVPSESSDPDVTGTVPSESSDPDVTGTVPSECSVIPCDVCGVLYESVRAMRAHRRTHTEEERKRQVCTVCGVVCANMRELADHRRTHPGVLPYQCRECGLGLRSNRRYRRHKHIENPNNLCLKCGIAFPNQAALQRHVEAGHVKEKKPKPVKSHKCMLCKKGYVTADGLFEHMSQKHTIKQENEGSVKPEPNPLLKEEPMSSVKTEQSNLLMNEGQAKKQKALKSHQCMLCNKRFVTTQGLTDHMSQKHLETQDNVDSVYTETNPLLREEPMSSLKTVQSNLQIEVQGKPKKQKAVKAHTCILCNKGYVTVEGLSQHMSQKHVVKLEKAGFVKTELHPLLKQEPKSSVKSKQSNLMNQEHKSSVKIEENYVVKEELH